MRWRSVRLMSGSFPNGGKKNRLESHSVWVTVACHRGRGDRPRRRVAENRVLSKRALESSGRAAPVPEDMGTKAVSWAGEPGDRPAAERLT
jgi:hypothetical protein